MLETIEAWNLQLGQTLESQLAAGSAAAVLVVFAAGVLTSFTPCVYPVIPVTVSYLGGVAGGNRRRAVSLSVVYVLGLAVIYAALGVVAALLGKTFGAYTRNPWVFGVVGVVLILFGISMFDIVSVRMPSFLTGIQGKGVQRGGYLGALLMGVAAAFVTAPCSAPVLGVLLLAVGRSQNPVWGSALLFVFALGLSLLLMVLGIFSGMLTALPKPGRWMVWVKGTFGVLMLILGGWYLAVAVGVASNVPLG